MTSSILISIIVPIHNGSEWINQCFEAILQQEVLPDLALEVCVCNDGSNDNTALSLYEWSEKFKKSNILLKTFHNDSSPKGVGYAKNRAVSISSGTYLCFQDIDDVMLPMRILEQFKKACTCSGNTIVGSQFKREPENSTERYTLWANTLSEEQLNIQVYTANGPTVVMPTWFCHRNVFDRVGGFSEQGKGTPEDLIFFYKHLNLGGKITRVDQCLLVYTYHPDSVTFSIDENTIWNIRLERLEKMVLSNWQEFTIWNAGKQGRKFYHSLSPQNQQKVVAFCDVDRNKVGKKYIPFDPESRTTGRELDIVHFKDASPPFIICVKINLTNGEFEKNLKALQLSENVDYILFS